MKTTKTNENKGLRISDNAADKIGELICDMIDKVQGDWKQPWVSVGAMEAPMSLTAKRPYNGFNAFMLALLQHNKGYKVSRYATMNALNEINVELKYTTDKEGKKVFEKPFPVLYWMMSYSKDGKYIKDEEYANLSDEEKDTCFQRWALKVYNVFNLDQTNYAEVYPEKYAKMLPVTSVEGHVCEQDYTNAVLDYEIEGGAWRCPIEQGSDDEAYYSISKDSIMLPKRNLSVSASRFYGTALHEMTHSTGAKECLNRIKPTTFGSAEYAKEELVAELTAAIVLHDLGVEKYLKEDSLPYLKSWNKTLKDPHAVKLVMDDVMSAIAYHKKAYANAELELNKKEGAA